jgi:hypothetical protein
MIILYMNSKKLSKSTNNRDSKLDLIDKLIIAVAISFFALASAYCFTMQFTETVIKGF